MKGQFRASDAPATAIGITAKIKEKLRNPYVVLGILYAAVLVAAPFFESFDFGRLLRGYMQIITVQDRLFTDYIAVGGLGAALMNVGITSLLSLALLIISKHKPIGLTFGTMGLVCGFAFFGKNPVNMLPIIFGAWAAAQISGVKFRERVLVALCTTCLAPILLQIAHFPFGGMGMLLGLPLGVAAGMVAGFIMAPLAAFTKRCHNGLNLYNVGFSSGIVGIVMMTVFRSSAQDFVPVNFWSYGNNFTMSIIIFIISVYFIIIGLVLRKSHSEKHTLRELMNMKAENYDYYSKYGNSTYFSMGILGIFCTLFILVIGGQLSGPITGAIISIIGFGAGGKKLRYVAPLFLGGVLAAQLEILTRGAVFQNPIVILAILFSSCLSPFSEEFGAGWGIFAGFVHVNLAVNINVMHGGMNLYNNGLAAGIVALVLAPVIQGFSAKKREKT